VGARTRVKVVKNKLAPPFKVAEFDIMFNEGISRIGSILDVALNMNIIEKRGSWFSFGSEQLAQGREAVKQFLAENPEIAERVYAEIRKKLDSHANADAPVCDQPQEQGQSSADAVEQTVSDTDSEKTE